MNRNTVIPYIYSYVSPSPFHSISMSLSSFPLSIPIFWKLFYTQSLFSNSWPYSFCDYDLYAEENPWCTTHDWPRQTDGLEYYREPSTAKESTEGEATPGKSSGVGTEIKMESKFQRSILTFIFVVLSQTCLMQFTFSGDRVLKPINSTQAFLKYLLCNKPYIKQRTEQQTGHNLRLYNVRIPSYNTVKPEGSSQSCVLCAAVSPE